MRSHTRETQATVTPQRALEFLIEGNRRFRDNLGINRDLLQQVNETRDGQWPFATILSCIDSRTSAEHIFDQGFGDIFSIRLAGTVVNEDVLGSMEFSCKLAGSRLLVVLGHSNCGAIKGACDHVQLGNLTTLLNKIQPAVYFERTVRENRTSKNADFVERVTELQVRRSLETIIENSLILRQMIEASEIGLVGAMYDIGTGEVKLLPGTLMIGEIKHAYLDASTGS